ncbi:Copper Transporter integral membrane protein that functions in high affinity copper transport [Ascosphaera aggregata]|nr:Copper Transporter integral membrane protein that functions in high affinity copper transport [Ascosphaera aggregata]
MDMTGFNGDMDHAHHQYGHGMGGSGDSPACKISMLWNWNTIDACFFTESWHIRSRVEYDRSSEGTSKLLNGYAPGLFGKPVISSHHGLAIGHGQVAPGHQSEPDIKNGRPSSGSPKSSVNADTNRMTGPTTPYIGDESNNLSSSSTRQRPFFQQTPIRRMFRAILYTSQFTVAYLLMLLAMYYNAYIFICIVLGTFSGHLSFSGGDQGMRVTER